MSDLVELLNDLNQSNRIEYSDYSQLMFCVQQLEEENEQLKQQIENIKRENEDMKTFLTNNIVNNTQSYLLSVSNGS